MDTPHWWQHARDIVILPVTVTIVLPYCLLRPHFGVWGQPLAWIGAGMFFGLGLTLFVWTLHLFHRIGKGTLAPWQPTQRLVVVGPYQYCRNPMICGVLGILLGETLLFGSLRLLLWAILFFGINNLYFWLKEEPRLLQRFGEEYADYKKRTPRWLRLPFTFRY